MAMTMLARRMCWISARHRPPLRRARASAGRRSQVRLALAAVDQHGLDLVPGALLELHRGREDPDHAGIGDALGEPLRVSAKGSAGTPSSIQRSSPSHSRTMPLTCSPDARASIGPIEDAELGAWIGAESSVGEPASSWP